MNSETSTLARLETICLSDYQRAEARAHVLRAEAIAEVIHRAWTGTRALLRGLVSRAPAAQH